MAAGREPEDCVLGEQPLLRREAAEAEPLVGMVERQLELPARAGVRVAGRLGRQPQSHLPQQLAPGEPEAVAPAHPHEMLDRGALEPGRRPARQVADARERPAPLPLEHELGRRLLAPIAHEPEPDSHSSRFPFPVSPFPFYRAPHITPIHIRQQNHDVIAVRVPSQRVERIKPHRLVVEERAVVLGRVVVPEPRRLVGEQPERRGVRFGEPEFRERDHLREYPLGGRLGNAARRGTVPELLPELRHHFSAAAPAHGAP